MRILLCLWLFLLSSTALAHQEIYINIPSFSLQFYNDNHLVKEYNIALGTPYEQTPAGNYRIFLKEKYPTWTPGTNFTDHTPVPPGPDNPLGTRWMEFKPGYGIHGTNKGWDIRSPVSGGCIRMHNKDVEELYEKVPVGTPVIITYETIFFLKKQDGLYVRIFPDIYHTNRNTVDHFNAIYAPYKDKYPLLHLPVFPADDSETGLEQKIANPPPINKGYLE